MISRGLASPPHAPEQSAEESQIPLSTPSHMFSESLKGGLKAFVAVEQLLEGQRVAEPQQPLEIPCTHIEVWTSRLPLSDRGC